MAKSKEYQCPFCTAEYSTKRGLKSHLNKVHNLKPTDAENLVKKFYSKNGDTKGGRPTAYDPSFPEKLIKFFDIDPWYDKELEHYGKNGEVSWVDYKRMANRLPTIRSFSKHIKVNVSTVYNWLNPEHPSFHAEFLDAFTHAKDLQKWFLIENGLNSCYNPIFAKFVAINITDMRDKVEVPVDKDGEEVYVQGFRFVSRDQHEKEANNTNDSTRA